MMFDGKCRLVAVSLFALTVGLAAPVQAMTIEEALATAIANHPRVQGAQAGRRAAEAEVDVERSGYLPTVDFRASGGYEWVNNSTTRGRAQRLTGSEDPGVETFHKDGALVVRQNLFDGFAITSRSEAADKRAAAAASTLGDARETVALRAAQAYLDVLRAREIVRLAEENVGFHTGIGGDIKLKADRGAASTADVRQAQNRMAAARSRLVQSKGMVREAQARFLEAVGTAAEALSDPTNPKNATPETPEDAIQVAVRNNPALIAAGQTFQSRDSEVGAARAGYWPTVDLELTGSRGDDVSGVKGPTMEQSALLVVRYNLYRGGRDSAQVQRALELKSQALQREAEIRRQLEQQVRTDHSAYVVASENLPIFRDKVQVAADVLDGYRQQFELGRRSLLDLLDAEDDLFNAKISELNADMGVTDARYRLFASMGSLLDSLNVAVPADAAVTATSGGR